LDAFACEIFFTPFVAVRAVVVMDVGISVIRVDTIEDLFLSEFLKAVGSLMWFN